MELLYVALAVSCAAALAVAYVIYRIPAWVQEELDKCPVVECDCDQLATRIRALEQVEAQEDKGQFTVEPWQTKLSEMEAQIASLVSVDGAVPSDDEVPNPKGCTITTHVWRKRPSLRSDHQEVYHCVRNCGSTLRHRFE